MSDVRGLYRPGDGPIPRTTVVPKATTREALATRKALSEFLEANLTRPVHFNEVEAAQRIDDALDTMTINERITIEIEMQNRNPTVHTFDYEPY